MEGKFLSNENICSFPLFLRLIIFQAQTYDPEGEYVACWLPELLAVPKDKRNFPGKSYIEQVVPLKFGNTSGHHNQSMTRRSKFGGRQSGAQRRWKIEKTHLSLFNLERCGSAAGVTHNLLSIYIHKEIHFSYAEKLLHIILAFWDNFKIKNKSYM